MIYVMGDIHGCYDKYEEMLKRIRFSDDDTLFVLGDVVDRGPEPVKVLRDMAMRGNVYPILGNHEIMMLDVLEPLLVEITEDNWSTHLTGELLHKFSLWQINGGDVTARQMRALPEEERRDLLDYVKEFPLYEAVDAGDKTFLLVHAGLGNYRADKKLREYTAEELAFMRPELDRVYYGDDVIVVAGHTPTKVFGDRWEIVRSGNAVFVDCGAVYGGRLACLCLDTMEEFYV